MLRLGLALTLTFAGGCLAEERVAVQPLAVPSPVAAPQAAAIAPASSVIFLAPTLDARPPSAPIGVDACDRYVALVDACPADARARQGATRKLLEKDAPSWREAARSSVEGRLAVTMACQAAIEGLRQEPCR